MAESGAGMSGFILNFHGIGAPPRAVDAGEAMVWISEIAFLRCLDIAQATGAGISFDDSNETDFTIARPALLERGLTARFFVLSGMIDTPTYMSTAHVRQLAAEGFTIGSHGRDHVNWRGLDDASLHAETSGSKASLEAIIDRPVIEAGIPFGRYDARVLKAVRAAGYTAAFSSDGNPRLRNSLPLPRLSIRQDTDIDALPARIKAAHNFAARVMQDVKVGLKSMR